MSFESLPLTPREFRNVLWRHRGHVVCTFGLLAVLTFVGVIFMPRSYISEAKLFIRAGRETHGLDATATTGQLLTVMESRETDINSLVEVLKSRSLYEQVAEKVGPESIIKGKLLGTASGDGAPDPQWLEALHQGLDQVKEVGRILLNGTNVPPEEQAVNSLEKMLEITTPRKSNVIMIRCKAKSPALANAVVKELLQLYRDEHARLNRTPGSYEFFKEQAGKLENNWQAATDKMRLAKNEMGIISIDGKRKMLQDQIAELELRTLTNKSELSASDARIADLKRSLEKLPEMIVASQAQTANQAADGMRQSLYTLQMKQQELQSRLTDTDPRLVAVRQQVAQAEKMFDDQQTMRTLKTHAVNPSRQALELELFKEQSQAESLRARGKSLTQLKGEALAQLAGLNQNEVQLASLQRDVDLAEKDYRVYADKREQARITQALIEERISNVQVAQDASFVSKPTGPSKAVVLGLGLIVALFGGIGVALLNEQANRTLQTPDDVRDQLDVPLVATIGGDESEQHAHELHVSGNGNGEPLAEAGAGPDDYRPNHPR